MHIIQQRASNTFQIVLVSMEGSKQTYALLLYDSIGWYTSNGNEVVVGFNKGKKKLLFTLLCVLIPPF